ncbi:MAG: tRNA pseudouridine(38-40) synthase TruA [Haloferacaceae archaeon]
MRAFRVAYDGRPFYGFQRQPDVPTVEDTLFDALRAHGVLDSGADKPPGYAAAGRTDAGVSAVAQTVAFECPEWLTPRAFNGQLPGTVRAWAGADVPAGFHATHDATRRTYTYHLYAPPAAAGDTPTAPTVDDDRTRAALETVCGEHDFHNLTTDRRNTVREITGSLRRDGDFLVLRISGAGFARELVRRVVTLVRSVGSGAADLAFVDRVLSPEHLDGDGVGPAPPGPLILTNVDYPGVDFERDEEAIETVREVFDQRRIEALSRSRAMDSVLDGVDDVLDGSGDG